MRFRTSLRSFRSRCRGGRREGSRWLRLRTDNVVREVDDSKDERAYIGHDMFPEVSVSVLPGVAVRDHVVGACCAELGDHQGRCGCGNDNGAIQVQGTGGVDSSKTCIATAGRKDVWLRADRKLFEAAEDVVANTSIVASV
jgi:hypothetical protein